MTRLYQYNDFNFKIVSTHNHLKHNNKSINKSGITDDDELQRISISRSKRCINEIIKCNHWDYFFTATVNGQYNNRYDLEACLKSLKKCIRNIKLNNKNFKYLFIIEAHKDGAFHFHGVCTDLGLYINDNGYFSNWYLDDLGFNSFSRINDITSVSYYILKYITKDCLRNSKGTCYFSSRGLKRATVSDIYDFSLSSFDIPSYHYYYDSVKKIKNYKYDRKQKTDFYHNDYVSSLDFNCNTISKDKLQELIFSIKEIPTSSNFILPYLFDFLNCHKQNLKNTIDK